MKRQLTQFGKSIKKALIDQQMTQSDLAHTVGTSKQYLRQIMIGDRPGKKYIKPIIQTLGLSDNPHNSSSI